MASQLAPASADKRFFGHPLGLCTLFLTEMFERFSYYGMRALFSLYMTKAVVLGGLGFSDKKAGSIYALYTSMVYLMCLAGGWVADVFIGQQRAVLAGGVFIALGEFCLFAPSDASFYSGLALLMLGTGFLKGNVSTIVGQLYQPGDPRRDSGFSIFYIGINIGAIFSPILCGAVGQHVYSDGKIGFRYGFALAGFGMLLGIAQYLAQSKFLGNAGRRPVGTGSAEKDRLRKRNTIIAGLVILAACAVVTVLGITGVIDVTPELVSDAEGYLLIGVSLAVFAWLIFGKGWTPQERKRATAILVLFWSSAMFWASFEQAGSSLNLFADRSTRCVIFGWPFPSSWFQSSEAVFVVFLAPVFAWLWMALGKHNPSTPAKFSLGLLFAALAFALMVPASKIAVGGVLVSTWWLNGTYLLQAFGELCLSPVGLSAMTKLAPERAAGFIMGIWFLSTSVGNWMAGKAGSLYSSMPLPTLFGTVAAISMAGAIALALLIKPTVHLMAGAK